MIVIQKSWNIQQGRPKKDKDPKLCRTWPRKSLVTHVNIIGVLIIKNTILSLNPEALWFLILTISCRAKRSRFCGIQTSSNFQSLTDLWNARLSQSIASWVIAIRSQGLINIQIQDGGSYIPQKKLGFLLNLEAWHRLESVQTSFEEEYNYPKSFYSYRVKTIYLWEAWNALYCLWRSLMWHVIVMSFSFNLLCF